jgi:hypothetical protein
VLFPADDVSFGDKSQDLVPGYMDLFMALLACCPILDYCQEFKDSLALAMQLSIILPINGASPLPPGIIGSTSLGHAGVAAIVHEHFGLGGRADAWLRDPITVAWLNVGAGAPNSFAMDVIAYEEVWQSLWPLVPSMSSLSFCSPLSSHAWQGLECLLSFHLLLHIVLYSCASPYDSRLVSFVLGGSASRLIYTRGTLRS